MKKKILLVIVVLSIPVIYSFFTDQVNRYEDVFEISLPTDMKKMYSTSTKDNWMGEGTFYEVYQLNKDAQFNMVQYKVDHDKVFEVEIKEILAQLNIDDKYYPEFKSQNVYNKIKTNDDELILMYNPDLFQLTTIIDIR